MKKITVILFLLINVSVFATNYYVKTGGDDAANGDISHPWATVNKVNTVWTAGTFNSGDSILFNRGDTFYGTITVKESGSAGNPIVIGACGTGADPIISGFSTIPSWTALNDSIYYYDITCESATNNLITVNGVNTPMGRWPHTGWMNYEVHSGSTSITDNELTNSPNWTGAELVIRKINWTLERCAITNHTNSVITYTSFNAPNGISATNGYGYFIQNDIKTLTNLGDWYYTGTRLYMYFGAANPSNYVVKITNLDKLLTSGTDGSTHYDYITIDNLAFEGSSIQTVELSTNVKNWIIKNCSFNYSGKNCIDATLNHNTKIINNVIKNTNNNAIRFISSGYSNVIRSNTIDRTGALMGMMYSDDDGADAVVLKDDGINVGTTDTVTYNIITNTGHTGIRVRYNNYYVGYNYINRFALIKNDAGGLYTWGTHYVTFDKNIILNGYGQSGGVAPNHSFDPPDPFFVNVVGIYIDEITDNINIINNIIADNRDGGIFVQMASYITVTGNTSYNNGWFQMALLQRYATNNEPIRHTVMNNNIFFCKAAGRALFPYMQICMYAASYETVTDINQFGTFDNNYYARPIDAGTNTNVFSVYEHNPSNPWNGTLMAISGWRAISGQDAHSTGSLGTAITDTADIHFIYNDTRVNKTFTLSAGMTDVANNSYSGNIVVAPFRSLILLGKGTITEIFPKEPIITPDKNSELFYLLPNPNDGRFSIELLTSLKNERNIVTVVNMTGEIVYKGVLLIEENTRQFDLSYLNSGTYILLITSDKIVSSKKFIKI